MLSSLAVQQEYQKLYVQLRKYLWSFGTVEKIADLEVAVYQAIPTIKNIKDKFDKLKYSVSQTSKDDEDFKKAMENFEDLISSDNEPYLTLNAVKEVIQHENKEK